MIADLKPYVNVERRLLRENLQPGGAAWSERILATASQRSGIRLVCKVALFLPGFLSARILSDWRQIRCLTRCPPEKEQL